MVRGTWKGLSWTGAHPGERMGRTRHPGAVSRAGQTELKAQSQGLTVGVAGRGCRRWAGHGRPCPVTGSERHLGKGVCGGSPGLVGGWEATEPLETGKAGRRWRVKRDAWRGAMSGHPRLLGLAPWRTKGGAWPHRQRGVVCMGLDWPGSALGLLCGDQATLEPRPHRDHCGFRPCDLRGPVFP